MPHQDLWYANNHEVHPRLKGFMVDRLFESKKDGVDYLMTLLNNGLKVNSRTTEGISLVHWSVRAHWPEAVEILVKRGADIHQHIGNSHNALIQALFDNRLDILEIFDQHCTINWKYEDNINRSLLYWASSLNLQREPGDECFYWLIDRGMSLRDHNSHGQTLMEVIKEWDPTLMPRLDQYMALEDQYCLKKRTPQPSSISGKTIKSPRL